MSSPLIHILINFILPEFKIVTMKFRYEVPSFSFRMTLKQNLKQVVKTSFKKSDVTKLLIINLNSWLFELNLYFSKSQAYGKADFSVS